MRLIDQLKVDGAIKPISLATTNTTGQYFNLKEWGRVLYICVAAAMAKTKTVVWQVFEATDGLGTGAQALTAATCTTTANSKAKAVTVAAGTVIATDALVINDGSTSKTFTCKTSGAVAADGEFNVGVSDTATMDNFVVALHTCLPKLYGVNSTGTVTIVARDPGNATITATTDDTTLTIATLEAVAYVEVEAAALTSGYSHIAMKATTDATIVVGATLIRGAGRHNPEHFVAASDVA